MKDKLIIFTLEDCIHCISLKIKLKELNISYIDVEINKNPEIWNKLVDQTGNESIPMIFISDDSDVGDLYIPDIDFKDEDEILTIIKNRFKQKGD